MKQVNFMNRTWNVPDSAKYITIDIDGGVWAWDVKPSNEGSYWVYEHPDDQGWKVGHIGEMKIESC